METHLIDINAICSKISLLKTNIHNAEEMVSLRLDTSRNELLIANTALTVLSCGIGFGAYVSGVFGMNLDQTKYLQPRKNSFLIVTMLSFLGVMLVFFIGYGYLKMAGILPERVKIINKPNGPVTGAHSIGNGLRTALSRFSPRPFMIELMPSSESTRPLVTSPSRESNG